jgi:hypothetical protein
MDGLYCLPPAGGRIRSQGNQMRLRRNHEWAEGGAEGGAGGRGRGRGRREGGAGLALL